MHWWVTTFLDVIGLLFCCAGIVFLLEPYIGLASLAVAGGIVLVGSAVAQRNPRGR